MDSKRKYRINVVADMTGVSAATLRAWERRYGIPVPSRTESSYRIYDEEDIRLIQRLRALCDEGMSPSEAAKVLLAEQEAEPEPAANAGDPFGPSRDGILEAVERFDPVALESAVQHALALGSASTIYDKIIAPAMQQIGDRWHAGTLTIGQEHLATGVLENAARKLLGLVQPSGGARQIVLACFPEDEHTLPLYGVALRLATSGFRIVMLGARTPAAAVRQAVQELRPVAVGLSVTVAPDPPIARQLIDDYANACGDAPWLVGGRAAASLRDFIEPRGGVVSEATDARSLVRVVEGLIARGRAGFTKKEAKSP